MPLALRSRRFREVFVNFAWFSDAFESFWRCLDQFECDGTHSDTFRCNQSIGLVTVGSFDPWNSTGRSDVWTDVPTSGRLGVRTSGHPDVRASGLPDVRTSGRPDAIGFSVDGSGNLNLLRGPITQGYVSYHMRVGNTDPLISQEIAIIRHANCDRWQLLIAMVNS